MTYLESLLRGGAAVLPVLALLCGLVLLDSYKLVRLRRVLASVLAGAVIAGAAYLLQTWILGLTGWGFIVFSRYAAPLIEELLKAAFVVYLIRTHRIGFLVDAAIHGFAIGAGFSVVENLYYVAAAPDMSFVNLVVRGFGTAVMHGGATAIFAVAARAFADRNMWIGLPAAWLFASVLHSAFNHLVLPPVLMTLLLFVLLPVVFLAVFTQSEKATRSWLGSGFDTDQHLLQLLMSDELRSSRVGEYLYALRERFPGEVVADMLCYLQIYAELSIRAKGMLMMREAGFDPQPAADVEAKLKELEYLRRSIGPTGHFAISPFLHRSSRDLWQMSLLQP